jgi:hypothetical protein
MRRGAEGDGVAERGHLAVCYLGEGKPRVRSADIDRDDFH